MENEYNSNKFDYSIKCVDNVVMIDINTDYKEMIERIISELNDRRINIARMYWQSKDDDDFISDFEPCLAYNYKLLIDIDCSNTAIARYTLFVLTQRLEQFTKLEKLYIGV